MSILGNQNRFPQFVSGDDGIYLFYQNSRSAGEEGEIYVSFRSSTDGKQWKDHPDVVGPIPYAGTSEPFLFSVTVRNNGDIVVAATLSAAETAVFLSEDRGESFDIVYRLRTDRTTVAPQLFNTSDGSIVLFVNENIEGLQTIVSTHSPDGREWSEPAVLEEDPDVGLAFLPVLSSTQEKDFVVFQGINLGVSTTYQLYIKESVNGGRTWQNTRRLTTFVDPTQTDDADLYDNQRADLVSKPDGGFYLVWERRYQGGSPQIFLVELDGDGIYTGFIEEVTGRFDLARFPRMVFFNDEPIIAWFTNPRGVSRVVMGQRGQFRWSARTISPSGAEATFATPIFFKERLHVVWQQTRGEDQSQVVYLEPDQRVALPEIVPVNFRRDEPSRSSVPTFSLRDPSDVSGIRAYSVIWSRNPVETVPATPMIYVPERTVQEEANEDGPWYLHVRASDFAGNWSEIQTLIFTRDTTPPPPVTYPAPEIDENSFLVSNTFTIRWNPPAEEDLAGYSVRLDYLGGNTEFGSADLPVFEVDQRVNVDVPRIRRTNVDNGLWLITVAPVDTVGNIGEATAMLFRTNKFQPFTAVYSVAVERDLVGRYSLRIGGRGFSSNGTVRRIFVDRDGTAPYDYEFSARNGGFSIITDRLIGDLLIERIEPDNYLLILDHEDRGLYIAPQRVTFEPHGIVKYGDFSVEYEPFFTTRTGADRAYQTRDILLLAVVILGAMLALISAGRLVSIGREVRTFNLEARALLTHKTVEQLQREGEATQMKVEGFSLRYKFAFFIVLLVFSVVLVVAVVLGRNILNRQEEILIAGLQDRVELLVEGMVNGSRTALENPQLNIDQLQVLANQSDAMEDALYSTITGLSGTGGSIESIYATNDPAIVELMGSTGEQAGESKIDTDVYTVGISRLKDTITDQVEERATEINRIAAEQLGEIPRQLAELSQEAQRLILGGAGEEEIIAIDEVRTALLRQARTVLAEIAGTIQSEPQFPLDQLDADTANYLFFKPVLDLVQGAGEDFSDYYRGTVRVEVSTQLIVNQMRQTRRDIILSTTIIAVLAVVIGVVGAFFLATIVVQPIDKLVTLVTEISETEDKSDLKGKSLTLKSRDELDLLANSINEMTAGLVKAAEANKDLMFGKETQKMFIPLEKISDEQKKTTGEIETDLVHFFGYYEGAKGVSGDYFSYQPLDERYYAFIKCDVAGKGIPAALIMVQVATVFLDHFRSWTLKSPGLNVSALVTRMNDLVAEREFKGRFAALTTGILDAKTGVLHLSNAGDNQIHIFRHKDGAVEQSSLATTPAAGVFTTDFIPSGFPQEQRKLESGDIMLLFTDGLEEAKRLLRDDQFKPILATEDHEKEGFLTEHVPVGSDGEEFGISRIHNIVAAVQAKSTYELVKVLNPEKEAKMTFNFSTSDGSIRDAVLAIVSLEKLFRIYRSPAADADSRVHVDNVVVEFLRKHFDQFNEYFSYPVVKDEPGEYTDFSYLQEDEQYDDITMLALKRK